MNLQVAGSHEHWEIQDLDEHRRFAAVHHCTLAEAQLLAAAPALRDALRALVEACETQAYTSGARGSVWSAVEAAKVALDGHGPDACDGDGCDPMEPDWDALAAREPVTQDADSRDAAGVW